MLCWSALALPNLSVRISRIKWRVNKAEPKGSTHRSPLARIPLEQLCSGRGDLLVYQERAATSSPREDPFTSVLDDPLLVSLSDPPQAVPDPRLPDPALGMDNRAKAGSSRGNRCVTLRVGTRVSYEAVRRVLRAARRR